MGRTACTEPQCLYEGTLYLYLTVELYLYSPCGPYGLYRASVPVQGYTLPLPYSRAIPLLPLWGVRPVQSLSACTRVHFLLVIGNQARARLRSQLYTAQLAQQNTFFISVFPAHVSTVNRHSQAVHYITCNSGVLQSRGFTYKIMYCPRTAV